MLQSMGLQRVGLDRETEVNNWWIVARQTPLSIVFLRQEYWSEFPFPSLGYLPDLGIEPNSPALAGGFSTTKPQGKPILQDGCNSFLMLSC